MPQLRNIIRMASIISKTPTALLGINLKKLEYTLTNDNSKQKNWSKPKHDKIPSRRVVFSGLLEAPESHRKHQRTESKIHCSVAPPPAWSRDQRKNVPTGIIGLETKIELGKPQYQNVYESYPGGLLLLSREFYPICCSKKCENIKVKPLSFILLDHLRVTSYRLVRPHEF